MAFDDTNFRPRDEAETPPPDPRVSRRDELVLLILACAFAFALLVLPLSLQAFADLVRALRPR